MSIKLGTNDISQVTPGSIRLGANSLDRVYDGTKLVWERGAQYLDELDTLGSFTQSSTGSGIGITSGEAYWNGTTDGTASALYSTQCLSDNQYIACVVGSYVNDSRSSGIFMHDNGSYGGYYAVGFTTASTRLVYTSGRWQQNSITILATAAGVASGDTVAAWNIGETFYVTINGTNVITQTVSGAAINGRHYQGFGMYRTTFFSSCRISRWYGGDAGAWGKI